MEDAIRQQARLGRTATQIVQQLDQDERLAGRIPHVRTIQRYVSEETSAEDGPWTLADSEDGRSVIAALHEVAISSRGGRLYITKTEALGIERIARIAPDIPPLAHFMLATWKPEQDVLLFLAFAPWRGVHERDVYFQAILPAGCHVPLLWQPTPKLVSSIDPAGFWTAVSLTHLAAKRFRQDLEERG